jgi:hypothetical protein
VKKEGVNELENGEGGGEKENEGMMEESEIEGKEKESVNRCRFRMNSLKEGFLRKTQ